MNQPIPVIPGNSTVANANQAFANASTQMAPVFLPAINNSYNLTLQRELAGGDILEIGDIRRDARNPLAGQTLNQVPYMMVYRGQSFAQAFDLFRDQVMAGVATANISAQPFFESALAGSSYCTGSPNCTAGIGLSLFADPASVFNSFRYVRLSQDTRTSSYFLRGQNRWNSDMSLSRKFKVTEDASFSLSAHFFNLFNHQMFSDPGLSLHDWGQVWRIYFWQQILSMEGVFRKKANFPGLTPGRHDKQKQNGAVSPKSEFMTLHCSNSGFWRWGSCCSVEPTPIMTRVKPALMASRITTRFIFSGLMVPIEALLVSRVLISLVRMVPETQPVCISKESCRRPVLYNPNWHCIDPSPWRMLGRIEPLLRLCAEIPACRRLRRGREIT